MTKNEALQPKNDSNGNIHMEVEPKQMPKPEPTDDQQPHRDRHVTIEKDEEGNLTTVVPEADKAKKLFGGGETKDSHPEDKPQPVKKVEPIEDDKT